MIRLKHVTIITAHSVILYYRDCVHDVHPITEGKRVTLTYSIMVVDSSRNFAYREKRRDYNEESIETISPPITLINQRASACVQAIKGMVR